MLPEGTHGLTARPTPPATTVQATTVQATTVRATTVRATTVRATTVRATTVRGLVFLALGIAIGVALGPFDRHIWHGIVAGIGAQDSGQLLTVAAQIAVTNTVRVFPIYWGAFTLMDAWVSANGFRRLRLLGYVIPAALVPLIYVMMRTLFGIPYDFGTPAVVALFGMMGLHLASQGRQGPLNEGIIFALAIFGLQWLGMAPVLGPFGFGRGDLTVELKAAADFLNSLVLLNEWSMGAGLLFIGIAFVMAKYMVDTQGHIALLRRHRAQERAMQQSAIRSMQTRTLQEMQRLVHDLKTPLTTIQGLAGLLGTDALDDNTRKAHTQRIDGAIDQMSRMISEMLYRDARHLLSGLDLIRYVQAHIAGGSLKAVRFDVGDNLPTVQVNAVRLTRAFVNLVQNAVDATPPDGAAPVVYVRAVPGKLRFVIRDFGQGMAREDIANIWQPGYTTKSSSGLGLPFAHEVIVDDLGGRMHVRSRRGKGTIVTVELPEVTV